MKSYIVAKWNHEKQCEEDYHVFYTLLKAWQYVEKNQMPLYMVYEANCVIDHTLVTEAAK